MRPGIAIVALWSGWALSWVIAAAWSNRTEARAPLGSEIRYRLPLLGGALSMGVPAHGYEGALRVWHIGWDGAWVCTVLVAFGIAFAWWARIHLGRLWSSGVTRKAEHRVVDHGPYGIVRHPIYTGLLLSVLATAAAKGTLPGIAGAALVIGGIWLKSRVEERWLERELGAGEYLAYKQRVPMLVPFWRAPH